MRLLLSREAAGRFGGRIAAVLHGRPLEIVALEDVPAGEIFVDNVGRWRDGLPLTNEVEACARAAS